MGLGTQVAIGEVVLVFIAVGTKSHDTLSSVAQLCGTSSNWLSPALLKRPILVVKPPSYSRS